MKIQQLFKPSIAILGILSALPLKSTSVAADMALSQILSSQKDLKAIAQIHISENHPPRADARTMDPNLIQLKDLKDLIKNEGLDLDKNELLRLKREMNDEIILKVRSIPQMG
jgi:ribosomal protein L4